MGKYTRNISKDPTKPGLHFKVVVDSTNTKNYAKRLQGMGPKALKNHFFEILRQESNKTVAQMHKETTSTGNLAFAKIARSVRISDKTSGFDTVQDKNTVAMSMWSQRDGASGFTPRGVRGSRGGYLAQIYEVGTGGDFQIFGDRASHPGFPAYHFFKNTKQKVMARVDDILSGLEEDLWPDDEPRRGSMHGSGWGGEVGQKEFEALKSHGIVS